VFNLVGKRYIFLGISLLIIIPGLISLIFRGLNVGIDFSGGTSFEFRPQNKFATIADVQREVKSFNFSELQVILGDDSSVQGKQNVWVRLNTEIDKNVQNAITTDITTLYSAANVNVTFDDLLLNPISPKDKASTVTVVTIAFKNVTPTTDQIKSCLAQLPDTSDPTKGPATSTPPSTTPPTSCSSTATSTPTPTTTATPTGTTTPTATATPKPTVTATPKPTATSSPTAVTSPIVAVSPTPTVANTNPSTIPVNVATIYQGTATQTITLLTLSVMDQSSLLKFKAALANSGNYIYVLDNATVSGSVAAETTRNAFLAVAAAAVFILLYIWFAFRKVTKPWRYGACAIIALLHDVLVVLGVFSILGWLLNIQIDALFITALLTICGFSVHDTIVVFDRIRENMQRRTSETFEQVVNASLVQTMARSLNTSLTVLFTLSALTLFGGTTIRIFTLTLLIGIFSGTYSSIFNASMLLVIWERGEMGTRRFNRDRTPDGREMRELARSR
jgi:preprotein translocase subunit SecF